MAVSGKKVIAGELLHEITKGKSKEELSALKRELAKRWPEYLRECEKASQKVKSEQGS
jgi:hypothetical protein